MAEEIYMMVISYRFRSPFFTLTMEKRSSLSTGVADIISSFSKETTNFLSYRSMRYDGDIIFWCSSHSPETLESIKYTLNDKFTGYLKANYSMISLYEDSPYLKPGLALDDTLRQDPMKYFVAYPMSKEPEWYLIDYEERKKIMAEHIGMALADPEGRSVRSYTTYSYGLGDQEFVVIYETDSLAAWSHATKKLREAKARKWIINETPILVGIHKAAGALLLNDQKRESS
ncbi:MAG: chlorite dismutase family protein [Thermoplasmataceae archaeon]